MKGQKIQTLVAEREIQKRLQELGAEIQNDYKGKNLVVVGVLKGSFIFMADLVRHIETPLRCDFIRVSSYEQNRSSGQVRLEFDMTQPIANKDVLLVEDIVDTGNTLRYLMNHLQTYKPASLKVCTLLYKDVGGYPKGDLDYIGFTVPNKYVIGYGLDDEGLYRSLPYVGFIEPR